MNAPLLLPQPMLVTVGLVLVHFLWQGALVALFAAVLLRVLQRSSPALRYSVSVAALAVMTLCPVVTWTMVGTGSDWAIAQPSPTRIPAQPAIRAELPPAGDDYSSALAHDLPVTRDESVDLDAGIAHPNPPSGIDPLEPYPTAAATPVMLTRSNLPHRFSALTIARTEAGGRSDPSPAVPWRIRALEAAAILWGAGITAMSLRLAFGAIVLARLRTSARPVEPALEQIVSRLRQALRVGRQVTVLVSTRVVEPLAFGLLRPVVLMPAAMLLQCPVDVVETIIAHELAHVRRGDIWVNLLQRLVETLFFFHPGVAWLSGRIRIERELCCDDLAVASTGKRVEYAAGLVAVAQQRSRADSMLLATGVLGGRTTVAARVRRVLGESPRSSPRAGWQGAVLVALLITGGISVPYLNASATSDTQDDATAQASPAPRPTAENGIASVGSTGTAADEVSGSALDELRNFGPEAPIQWPEQCDFGESPVTPPATTLVENRVAADESEWAQDKAIAVARVRNEREMMEPAIRAARALQMLRAALLDNNQEEAALRFRPHGTPATRAELDALRADLAALAVDLAYPAPWMTERVILTDDRQHARLTSDDFAAKALVGDSHVVLITETEIDAKGTGFIRSFQVRADVDRRTGEPASFLPHIRFSAGIPAGFSRCFHFQAFAQLADRRPAADRQPVRTSIKVFALANGVVSALLIEQSAQVKKGDLLVKLDSAEIELALQAAQVRLESAMRKRATLSSWVELGRAEGAELDEAGDAVRLAEIELRQWQLRLERTEIRSPEAGEATLQNVAVGSAISAGTQVAYITVTRPAASAPTPQ
jgi:beta-lactamase regulating signal transducer with metallopeptidase domain/biotin carboxyl carrier protein